MDTGADCRIRAAEFLVQVKHEPEREVHLIGMSESWLRLAVQADQIQVLVDHLGPVIPRNPKLDLGLHVR